MSNVFYVRHYIKIIQSTCTTPKLSFNTVIC